MLRRRLSLPISRISSSSLTSKHKRSCDGTRRVRVVRDAIIILSGVVWTIPWTDPSLSDDGRKIEGRSIAERSWRLTFFIDRHLTRGIWNPRLEFLVDFYARMRSGSSAAADDAVSFNREFLLSIDLFPRGKFSRRLNLNIRALTEF